MQHARRTKICDNTVAMVLELHRSGARLSYQDIADRCKAAGLPISKSGVACIVQETHAETVGAAQREIREQVIRSADRNVARMEAMAELLAACALTGVWPGEDREADPMKPHTRVAAARDAAEVSSRILSYLGVQDGSAEVDGVAIAARIREVYGLMDQQTEEQVIDGQGAADAVSAGLAH
jgi:hypothetical protein